MRMIMPSYCFSPGDTNMRPRYCSANIASIEEPAVIAKILAHLERKALEQYPCELPLRARAPPAQSSVL